MSIERSSKTLRSTQSCFGLRYDELDPWKHIIEKLRSAIDIESTKALDLTKLFQFFSQVIEASLL